MSNRSNHNRWLSGLREDVLAMKKAQLRLRIAMLAEDARNKCVLQEMKALLDKISEIN